MGLGSPSFGRQANEALHRGHSLVLAHRPVGGAIRPVRAPSLYWFAFAARSRRRLAAMLRPSTAAEKAMAV